MTHYDMVTVGGYYPAHDRNTIRKMAKKYTLISAGDKVTMTYCYSVDGEGKPLAIIATEELSVSAVAMAELNTLVRAHFNRNHAPYNTAEGLRGHLGDLYPDVEDDTPFLAIYFA